MVARLARYGPSVLRCGLNVSLQSHECACCSTVQVQARGLRRKLMRTLAAAQTERYWIDCDAGVDDAQALAIVVAANVDVVGISCVAGNVGVEQVVVNVDRILRALGRPDIPLYCGAHYPLHETAVRPGSTFHGVDGLADVPHVDPAPRALAEIPLPTLTAVDGLLNAARRHSGRLHVIALGPLTNIAMAHNLRPSLRDELASLTVMGGTAPGAAGNVTPHAEFNFWADPIAAHIVMTRLVRVRLVTWTLTLEAVVPWASMTAYFTRATTAGGKLLAAAQRLIEEEWTKDGSLDHGYAACDAVAAAVAVQPELIVSSELHRCEVVWTGDRSRWGACTFDVSNGAPRAAQGDEICAGTVEATGRTTQDMTQQRCRNVTLVTGVDEQAFLQLFLCSVGTAP